MRIGQVIDILRNGPGANFIWGAGCSGLHRTSITYPGDRSIWNAVKRYDSDPLLSQIKRNFYRKTDGLEDVHSCLRILNGYERNEVLTWRTNWAGVCLAELLRIGRAARVLTTNFDTSLVATAAKLDVMPPVYRKDFPELASAPAPTVYLLGDAPDGTLDGLVRRGASTGPWIVIGCSGKHFGLIETLLAVDRFEHGLFWIGHFHEEPPEEVKPLFHPARNAHSVSGFDADSFMAYVLRDLGQFPPPALRNGTSKKAQSPAVQLEGWLSKVAERRRPETDFREVLEELARVEKGSSAEVRALTDKVLEAGELEARLGFDPGRLGIVASRLAENRPPREIKPLLLRAADLMEPLAAGDVMGHFAEICEKLAEYSRGDHAREWYARADVAFGQMDFGPHCGAPLPYGHYPRWAKLLAEWSCFEAHEQSEALFERARRQYLDTMAKYEETANRARSSQKASQPLGFHNPGYVANTADSARQKAIVEFILAIQRRARMIAQERARVLLQESRTWIEQLQAQIGRYNEMLARQLFREAECTPTRQQELLKEAGEQFRVLLTLAPGQAADIYCNWAAATGELAMARSGAEALELYADADRKFQEVEKLNPNQSTLRKNWCAILMDEARESGGPPELWDRAKQQAEMAEALDAGSGAYNLACLAAEMDDPNGVRRWMLHAADHAKIPRVSHILSDKSFLRNRRQQWFPLLLDEIFDAGLDCAESHSG